jgi:RNA polymerase sigma-70 factor, ECF subfamily
MFTPEPVRSLGESSLAHQSVEWLARIREGDEAAFESLFRAFAPGLCAFVARYVGSRAVGEELVQDLFLRVWQKRAELSVEQGVATYLYTAARNRAINYLRHEARAAGSTAVIGHIDASQPSEGELLELLDLHDAIERLPARCRLIFTLSRQHDMTYAEIARSLGLSVKTVEVQMGRALKALRSSAQRG